MTRLTLKREDKDEEQKEEQVVMKWSMPKVLIAIGLIALIGMAGVYAYDNLSSLEERTVAARSDNKAQIRIPSERKIEQLVEDTKKSISGIDAANLVDSQPEIKKAIENLEKLTTSDTNAKKVICDAVCK